MKKLNLIAIILIFCFASCSKTKIGFAYSGTLTGADAAMTVCSGGIYLKTGSKLYHIEELPGMSNEDLYKLNFPITIWFNGTQASKCIRFPDDGYFTITSYKF